MRLLRILVPLFLVGVLLCPGPVLAGAVDDIKAGNKAAMSGDLRKAIMMFNKAINSGELSPQNLAVAYNNRGSARDDMGQVELAIRDYSEAVKADPNYAPSYYNRSFAYERKGLIPLAIKDMEKAARLDPDDQDYNQRLYYLRNRKDAH